MYARIKTTFSLSSVWVLIKYFLKSKGGEGELAY